MLRCTHPSYRRRNLFEAAIYTKPGASGTHEPPSGGPHIGGAPATPIAALSGSTHKAPGSAGGYLLAFLGLVPSERSTGDNVRRAGLTLAGNRRARRALVEGAWTYRYQARVSAKLQKRLEDIPKPVRDIAWKAQVRLCGRFRRLAAIGKKRPVIVAAIAREMAAFLWAIGRHVAPAS